MKVVRKMVDRKDTMTLYRREVSPGGKVKYVACAEMFDRNVVHHGETLIVKAVPGCTSCYRLEVEETDDLQRLILAKAKFAKERVLRAYPKLCEAQPVAETSDDRERIKRAYEAYLAAGGRPGDYFRGKSIDEVVDLMVQVCMEALTTP